MPDAHGNFLLAFWEDAEDERDARHTETYANPEEAERDALKALRAGRLKYVTFYKYNVSNDDFDLELRSFDEDDLKG